MKRLNRKAQELIESVVTYFNHPAVFELKPTDPERRFILKTWRDWDGE